MSKSEHQASLETTALATQVNHCANLPSGETCFARENKYCYAMENCYDRENSFVARVTSGANIVTPGKIVLLRMLCLSKYCYAREGGGERTFTVIHRRGNGNSWVEAVVSFSPLNKIVADD